MNLPWIQTLCTWVLATSLVVTPLQSAPSRTLTADVATGTPVFAVRSQQPIPESKGLTALSGADVVYLGETHNQPADHALQLDLLQRLYQQRPHIVLAMEMFQRPAQPLLDRYVSGAITATELRDRSEYDRRWGYDWEFYAPMLRFARAHQLPVIALNTPTEVTRKVAKYGLERLAGSDRRFIPPAVTIDLSSVSYRQRLQAIYREFHQGESNAAGFERFFQAQVLWDETMAERIAQVAQAEAASLVVVLVGQGHLLYGDGIPQRVAHRVPTVKQISVLLNPSAELRGERAIADYLWDSPDRPEP